MRESKIIKKVFFVRPCTFLFYKKYILIWFMKYSWNMKIQRKMAKYLNSWFLFMFSQKFTYFVYQATSHLIHHCLVIKTWCILDNITSGYVCLLPTLIFVLAITVRSLFFLQRHWQSKYSNIMFPSVMLHGVYLLYIPAWVHQIFTSAVTQQTLRSSPNFFPGIMHGPIDL